MTSFLQYLPSDVISSFLIFYIQPEDLDTYYSSIYSNNLNGPTEEILISYLNQKGFAMYLTNPTRGLHWAIKIKSKLLSEFFRELYFKSKTRIKFKPFLNKIVIEKMICNISNESDSVIIPDDQN
jgi:hypothetical protein